jgi:hypothetical protein
MKRLAFAAPVAILAAVFAGCTTPGPNNPASAGTSMAPVAQPVGYWSGTGVVQSVNPAPGPIVAGPNTSSRNPSTPSESGLYRLGIRMDNGQMMYVDTPSRDFSPGTRVQLSDNNEIRRM